MAITSVIGQASPPHKTWCQDCSAKPRPSQAYSSLKQVSYIFGNCSQNQAQLRLPQQSWLKLGRLRWLGMSSQVKGVSWWLFSLSSIIPYEDSSSAGY